MKLTIDKNKSVSANKMVMFNILGVVLLQGISFLTAPIFTRMLGAEQYGIYGVFMACTSVLSSIMGFNVGSSIGTGMYKFKEDYLGFRNSVFLLGIVVSTGISLVFVLCGELFTNLIGYPFWLIVLMPVYSMSMFIVSYMQSAFVFEKRPLLNLLVSLCVSVLNVGVSIYLVMIFPVDQRYIGRIVGSTMAYFAIAIVVGALFYHRRPEGVNKQYWGFALAIGMPLVLHILSQNILSQSDRIMMSGLGTSNSDIGQYTVFYSITSILSIILSALNSSWVPFYYEFLDVGNNEEIGRRSKNYIELLTVLSCGFILLSKEVGHVYAGDEYFSGIGVIPILVLSVFFTFMYQFPVNFEMFYKESKYVAMGTIGAALSNIGLNYLLIPSMSLYGAAIATAISYILLFVFHYFISKKIMKNKFHMSINMFYVPLCLIVLCSASFYCIEKMWYMRWIFGVLIGIAELLRIYRRKSIF